MQRVRCDGGGIHVDPYLVFHDIRRLCGRTGPVGIEWRGTVDVPVAALDAIGLHQVGTTTSVVLDGEPVVVDTWEPRVTLPPHLAPGSHSIRIAVTVHGEGVFSLWWRLPGHPEVPVPSKALHPPLPSAPPD